MLVEQTVFASGKTRYGEGYHVVARSAGISRETVVGLTHWSPSHSSLQSTNADFSSLNYHPLPENRLAVSRTVYGDREFSGRGGLQVVTMALVLTQQQFSGYDNHAFRLMRVARAMGLLRWQPRFAETLPPVELPDEEESERLLQRENLTPHAQVSNAIELLRAGKRVAIVGSDREHCEAIVDQLGPHERVHCFFSTGLNASNQRPFKVQVFEAVSKKAAWRLESNNIQIMRSSST